MSFSYERFCKNARFDTDAQGNSEMAYDILKHWGQSITDHYRSLQINAHSIQMLRALISNLELAVD